MSFQSSWKRNFGVDIPWIWLTTNAKCFLKHDILSSRTMSSAFYEGSLAELPIFIHNSWSSFFRKKKLTRRISGRIKHIPWSSDILIESFSWASTDSDFFELQSLLSLSKNKLVTIRIEKLNPASFNYRIRNRYSNFSVLLSWHLLNTEYLQESTWHHVPIHLNAASDNAHKDWRWLLMCRTDGA